MDVFYALAEPRRRRIVELLASRGRLSAGEISSVFDVTAQAISQHLRVLLNTGVLTVERLAQKRMYSLNVNSMKDLEAWANRLGILWNFSLDRLESILTEEK